MVSFKFTELDYMPHVDAKGMSLYHGELRPVVLRTVPEGVGFANFLQDDPELTAAAGRSYDMKLDIANQKFLEEVLTDYEEVRKQYPSVRKFVDEFEAINGRLPNARELLEMARWNEMAEKEDVDRKKLLDERRKILGEDARAVKWLTAEQKHRQAQRTEMYKLIAEKTRKVRLSGRQEWEEIEPPIHPCNGLIWERIDGTFSDGWIVGDITIYFRGGNVYKGPYVHYCPAYIVDPPCMLGGGALSKIHLFNAECCVGHDIGRFAPGRTRQPKCERTVNHWGTFYDRDSGIEYQGTSVDNHFAVGAANGHLVVKYPDGSKFAGVFQNGVWVCGSCVFVCACLCSRSLFPSPPSTRRQARLRPPAVRGRVGVPGTVEV